MIDVFCGDGAIDWAQVRDAGHCGAICKATEGTVEIDRRLAENLAGMKAAGMVRGAYHFFHVAVDPKNQANHFLNALRDAGYDFANDLPPAVDLEDENAGNVGRVCIVAAVAAFLKVVEGATGRRCLIYASKSWANDFLGDAFAGHPLWLAEYGMEMPTLPDGWSHYAIWQYSEHGTVPGVPNGGQTDLNRFAGDEAALREWASSGVLS